MRGPGTYGTANYLVDDYGTCESSRPSSFDWSVYGNRTIQCPAGYYPDDHNPPETCWRQDPCPVADLTPIENIPPNGPDVLPLTQLLEQSRGADLALTTDAQTGMQCFVGKASGIGITAAITSGTRTIAYQNHLVDVWDKIIQHNNVTDSATWEACRQRREKVIAEKGCNSSGGCEGACTAGSHCIRYQPAVNNSRHTTGKAFDVSQVTVASLLNGLAAQQPPQSMSELLANPTACNLIWGGDWIPPDNVHFELH